MNQQLKIGWITLFLAIFLAPASLYSADKVLKMSTTTSTLASGLLDVLLPEYTKDTGVRVKVIAKGTGAAIRDGMDGNVDVIFVHAKSREMKFIEDGYGTKRYAIMHNDFVVLGPKADPADVGSSPTAAGALSKIARAGAIFSSRGDDSGTHTKEQSLWKSSGVPMVTEQKTIIKKGKKRQIKFSRPAGSWYRSLGQGMGKTLTYADEKAAYTLSDRGTYIKYKFGREVGIDLEVLNEGDTGLANPYGVIPINPKKHPHVQFELADQFAQWLVSRKAQRLINNYKLIGKQLFYPDAIPNP